jgi:protein phosphatase
MRSVEADLIGPLVLQRSEVLLLSSDGLHGVLTEADMSKALARPRLQEVADGLVRMANRRGGPDNISVALYRPPSPAEFRLDRTTRRAGAFP